jgi:hypothetical protein
MGAEPRLDKGWTGPALALETVMTVWFHGPVFAANAAARGFRPSLGVPWNILKPLCFQRVSGC